MKLTTAASDKWQIDYRSLLLCNLYGDSHYIDMPDVTLWIVGIASDF